MIRFTLVGGLFLCIVNTAMASDCGDIKGLLRDMARSPEHQRGDPLTGGRVKSQLRLSGAYECLFSDKGEYEVSCIWFSQSYEAGRSLFGAIRTTLLSCPFVVHEDYHIFKYDGSGEESDFFEVDRLTDPGRKLRLHLGHHNAFTFDNSDLGSREVELSVANTR